MKTLSRVLLVTVLAFSQLNLVGQDKKTSNASPEPGLERVASLIHQLRTGDLQRFRIDLGTDNFTILKSVETALSENQAKAELNNGKPGPASIRFTRTQELLCVPAGPRVWIEKAINIDNDFRGSVWSRRTLEVVGTYPNSAWGAFAEIAIANGLSDFSVDSERRAELWFDSDGPHAIQYGAQSLILPQDFYRMMRVSTEFKPAFGRNGFVVLIHDPHQSVIGRFALVEGLHTLLSANSGRPVEFLVEGAFPEKEAVDYEPLSARILSDGGLAGRIKGMSESTRSQLIYSMLSTYLIDSPLAYRILYQRMDDIHAFAIDDNRFLKEVKTENPNEEDVGKAFNAILASLPEEQFQVAGAMVGKIQALRGADAQQISDILSLRHSQAIASEIRSFISLVQSDPATAHSLGGSIAVLEGLAKQHDHEVAQDERALKRNITMLKYIKQEAAHASQVLPIAFIGSYHTQGIVAGLRGSGIGYVVIEPRLRLQLSSRREDETFDNFLFDPNAYFASLAKTNKGLAGLTQEQVEQFHVPFMMKQQERLAQQLRSLEGLFAGQSGSKINGSRIAEAVRQNASLNEAIVEIGGGDSGVPPNVPRGAFAYFDESGGKRRLLLLGANDDRWSSEERYRCLERAIFDLPTGEEAAATLFHLSKHYQDEKSGRVYYTSYDRSSKRLYVIETSIANAGALLSLSAIRRGGAVNIHVVVSDIIPGENSVEHTNGDSGTGMMN